MVGSEGVGNEGVGNEGVGNKGVGSEGVGNEGVESEGVGSEGVTCSRNSILLIHSWSCCRRLNERSVTHNLSRKTHR